MVVLPLPPLMPPTVDNHEEIISHRRWNNVITRLSLAGAGLHVETQEGRETATESFFSQRAEPSLPVVLAGTGRPGRVRGDLA